MLIQQPCSFFNICSCSCLLWAAPQLCCRAPEPVSFSLLSIYDSTAPSAPSPGRSSLGPRRRPLAFGALGTVWSTWSTTESHRNMTVRGRLTVGTHHAHGRMHATERGKVNVVKERLPSEVYCTWRVSAGSTAAASKCLLITRKIMIPPTNSRDPLDGPPYFAKKMFAL